MIYLDNGATTFPKPYSVKNAVMKSIHCYGANPGRSGHKMSLKAAETVYSCRENASVLFKCKSPENVIIMPNCTTALNTVIKGILSPGDHAVISSLEHNAVVRPLEKLKEIGVEYSIAQCIPCDDEATIDNFRKSFKSNTRLVICTHASNVFGIKLPVERIAALCRINGILCCVDAAQTAGIEDIDLNDSCIDYLCTAGHKGLYGPMGTGLLVINSDIIPESLIQGGTGSLSSELTQPSILPDKFESGTPNLPCIAGLNEGIKFVIDKTTKRIREEESILINMLYNGLSKIHNVVLYAPPPDIKYFTPVLSFNIVGFSSEEISSILDSKYSIATRAGLHCAPLAHKQFGTEDIGTVRAVMSAFSTPLQVQLLLRAVKEIIYTKK